MQKNRLGNFPTRFIIEPKRKTDSDDTFESVFLYLNA